MRLYDEAFDVMWDNEDYLLAMDIARKYFKGEKSNKSILEILSEGKATSIKDVSYLLERKD